MIKILYKWLLPAACVLCGDFTHTDIDLCTECYAELPLLENNCLQCGLPIQQIPTKHILSQQTEQDPDKTQDPHKKLNHDTREEQYKKRHHSEHYQYQEYHQQHCGNCLKIPLPYDRMIALCHYQEPIESFISALKFNGQLCYAQLLGKLLANQLSKQSYHGYSLPQCIIPIPLHHKRLRERGFNQALEIARPIAKQLAIPILHDACIRQIATQSQALIHAKQRRHNLRNAFVINRQIDAEHIAIIDDVVTTGSTVAELSGELRQVGVKKIDIWCCARTILNMPTI